MVVLDTDHISLLDRNTDVAGQRLRARLLPLNRDEIATTIVTYEEQTRGWMAYMARTRTISQQVEGYRRMLLHLQGYRRVQVLPFDELAAVEFQRLHRLGVRIGNMDLKIAAITLTRNATLLSRNLADFRKAPGLSVEDWSQ